MTRTIPLTKGYVALVDDEDYERIVASGQWYAQIEQHGMYARRRVRFDGKRVSFRMHRLIMDAPPGTLVDHINGDGLDNRRVNLRLCTRAENQQNQRRTRGRSRFKGICFDARRGKWQARICVNGRLLWLGYYIDEISAALAYDAAATLHRHEFAATNATLGLIGPPALANRAQTPTA